MTVFADLRRVVDPLVGGRFWLTGNVPADHEFPYVSAILDPFDELPDLEGDGRTMAWRSFAQLDLWERTGAEDAALRRALRDGLDGLRLTSPYVRARIRSLVRVPEPVDSLIVHHALTVAVAERVTAITVTDG